MIYKRNTSQIGLNNLSPLSVFNGPFSGWHHPFKGNLDIDKLDISILDGATKVVESIDATDDTIVVESVDQFLVNDGSVLIGDEVIYYENAEAGPNIALSPGISYDQVKLKWINLASPLLSFDGSTQIFPLTSQDNPIAPPSVQHLIV